MITTLLTVIIVLIIALYFSVMLLWWRSEQEQPAKTIKRRDVIHTWNKAARLGRRSWYTGLRYSKQVTAWGNKKVRNAFVAIFPKSKAAFVEPNPLTGLEHGPSSYFLANLTKVPKAKVKRTYTKRKKVEQIPEAVISEEISDTPKELSG